METKERNELRWNTWESTVDSIQTSGPSKPRRGVPPAGTYHYISTISQLYIPEPRQF